jgi:hypothetical protein
MRELAILIATGALLACTTQRDRPAPPDASSASSASSAVLAPPATTPAAAPRIAAAPVDAATAAPLPALPATAWVWKAYRGDHFSVLFPGEPRVTVLPLEEDKLSFDQAVVDVPGGQVSFLVGFTDHSAEAVAKPDEFLEEQVNKPRRGTTEVLHKRAVTLPGGHPGRVLIMRRNISGTPLRIYSRLYLVKQRMYSLIVSTLDEGGVDEEVVKKFMDSFKLLG